MGINPIALVLGKVAGVLGFAQIVKQGAHAGDQRIGTNGIGGVFGQLRDHEAHEPRETGFGFVADLGVSIGKAKVTVDQNLTENHPGLISQADVDAETRDLKDKVGKLRILPHVAVGMSYRY